MDFIRARSGEQKRIRIEQITNVAAELYVEIGYDKVTYSEIGRKLNFTRRNLYNYFRCKEDIFLTLLLQDIEKMVEDAEKTFTEPVEDQEKFCLAWAGMLLRHQRMLALFSIVNTVILKDATSDVHRSFRIEMNRSWPVWNIKSSIILKYSLMPALAQRALYPSLLSFCGDC